MDKQPNRKKRRSRGDGVTSYRVTSSLSLSDAAYEHQQRAAQQAPAQGAASPYAQAGYETPQAYDQQAYDQNYDYSQQQAYDQQGYDQNYDYSQQQGYDQQGYDQNYDYSQQQGYEQQGYDQNYDYSQQQGYEQQGYDQQAYDPNYDQQGYYDHEGNYHYYQDQNGYPEEQATAEVPRRKRKIESVGDYYAEIMGEGQVFATDAEDSPYEPKPSQQRSQYLNPAHLPAGAQPAGMPGVHMGAHSPLVQMLGPAAGAIDLFFKLQAKWKQLSEKIAYYTDMVLDLQDSVQKEMKEAATLAFKGFMNQLKQRSPLAVPYQNPAYAGAPGAAPGAPGAYPVGEDPALAQASRFKPVSFVDLQELNVEFTDNYDQPLFDFAKFANSQYKVSKMIVDPAAMEAALWAIRECASRAGAIPPAQEGPYANIPLNEVMDNIVEEDLMAFLNYVKAFPGNYVSRNLKISETFATWVVYGAPTP